MGWAFSVSIKWIKNSQEKGKKSPKYDAEAEFPYIDVHSELGEPDKEPISRKLSE